jgi:hypothetical protein
MIYEYFERKWDGPLIHESEGNAKCIRVHKEIATIYLSAVNLHAHFVQHGTNVSFHETRPCCTQFVLYFAFIHRKDFHSCASPQTQETDVCSIQRSHAVSAPFQFRPHWRHKALNYVPSRQGYFTFPFVPSANGFH